MKGLLSTLRCHYCGLRTYGWEFWTCPHDWTRWLGDDIRSRKCNQCGWWEIHQGDAEGTTYEGSRYLPGQWGDYQNKLVDFQNKREDISIWDE